MPVAWPLKASANGRYLVDQNGVPFRLHGFSVWDMHITLTRADQLTVLEVLASQGITALHSYVSNPVPYYTGGPQPKNQAGTLPFSLNATGGAWNGDPTFANHDAAMDSPVDAYHATVAQFTDDGASFSMATFLHPFYQGAKHATVGDKDGWAKTLTNAHNTQSICQGYGTYLASGSTTFTGFAASTRPYVHWLYFGDSGVGDSTIGTSLSTNHQAIFTGLQNAGATQLRGVHVTHDNYPDDMTDLVSGGVPKFTMRGSYTTPATGETYVQSGACYSKTPILPTYGMESNYIADRGNTRDQIRYTIWGIALNAIAGMFHSHSPVWGFFASPDGTTGGVTTDCQPSCWQANTAYLIEAVVHVNGNWYKCTTAGTSGASGGPSGTGSSIPDGTGTLVWKYLCAVSSTCGGMLNLFTSDPGFGDYQLLGAFFQTIEWWKLIPSARGGTNAIVTSGGGTQTAYVDGTVPSGTADFIVAAAAEDLSCIVCYVPTAHSGAFSIDMTRLGANIKAFWVDITKEGGGLRTPIGAFTGSGITVPGANAAGKNDWLLVVRADPRSLTRYMTAACGAAG